MRLKVMLLLAIGLMYYGYVRENTDRAMTAFDSWKTSYLTVIDQAAAGEMPSTPEMNNITIKNSLSR